MNLVHAREQGSPYKTSSIWATILMGIQGFFGKKISGCNCCKMDAQCDKYDLFRVHIGWRGLLSLNNEGLLDVDFYAR